MPSRLVSQVFIYSILTALAIVAFHATAAVPLAHAISTHTPDPGATVPEDAAPTLGPRLHDADEELRAIDRRNEKIFRKLRSQINTPLATKLPTDTGGGDDVLIFSTEIIAQEYAYDIDIAETGEIYLAVQEVDPVSGSEIDVWSSPDGGETWDHRGNLRSNDPDIRYTYPSIVVAEGAENRVYVSYVFHQPNGVADSARVSFFELGANPAIWSHRVPMSALGIDFDRPHLATDSMNWNNYYLYLVAEEDDGASNDIWFARSTTYGDTWDADYEIGTLGGNTTNYYKPKVTYSVGGMLHVTWYLGTYWDETVDDAIRYRRANDRAEAGIADWDAVKAITSTNDGFDDNDPTVAGHHTNNYWHVLLNFTRVPDGGGTIENVMRLSDDNGATFAPADEALAAVTLRPHVMAVGSTDQFAAWGSRFLSASYGVIEAVAGAPLSWSTPEILADETYFGSGVVHQSMSDFDVTRGNRIGAIWSVRDTDPGELDHLYFDAQWRRDPGYPNIEDGFPVDLTDPPVTPPALADVDGDERGLEIVFGDEAGRVHVFDFLGQELPGFPVETAQNISDESVAVGDLDGNGLPEIVAGTDRGQVFCWDSTGNLLPGWPRDLETFSPAYVSIEAISKLQARDIVVTSGNEIHLLRFDGSEHDYAPFPIVNPEFLSAAAALGDLDADDEVEIVVAAGSLARAYNRMGVLVFARAIPGVSLVESPTLGDLDLDTDLEVVVPTNLGEVYVLDHTGANHPGWPFLLHTSDPLTEVAIANITRVPLLDLAVSSEDSDVYLMDQAGNGYGGWPQSTLSVSGLIAMPNMDPLAGSDPDINIGDRNATNGRSWDPSGALLPAWPKDIQSFCKYTPATGDLDADDRMEAVFLTTSKLVVLDTGGLPETDEARRWPMYGHDAQRTGCADCVVDVVTAVEPGIATTRVAFAMPYPNPAVGSTAFRYTLPSEASVRLEIFDQRGRRVRTLVRAEEHAGDHVVSWDVRDQSGVAVSRGHYFGRLSVEGRGISERITRRVVVVD